MKRNKTSRRSLPSAQKFGANAAAAVTSKQNRKDLMFVAAGAAAYAVVPTLVSKVFKTDMSGLKGVAVGIVSGLVFAGFGGSGYAALAGVVGAFVGHTFWSKLNGLVVYPALGQYLWRWDPSAKQAGLQAPPAFADALSGVEHITLPNGAKVPVYTSRPANVLSQSKSAELSDYVDVMHEGQQSLSGYAPGLGGFEPTMGDYVQSLNDDGAIANMDEQTQGIYAELM